MSKLKRAISIFFPAGSFSCNCFPFKVYHSEVWPEKPSRATCFFYLLILLVGIRCGICKQMISVFYLNNAFIIFIYISMWVYLFWVDPPVYVCVCKYTIFIRGFGAMASTLLLAVVFVLDVVAFSLAVAAEQRRTSVSFSLFTFPLFPYKLPSLSCFLFFLRLGFFCSC